MDTEQSDLFLGEYAETIADAFNAGDDRPLEKQQRRTMATVGRLVIAAANGNFTMGSKQSQTLERMGLLRQTNRKLGGNLYQVHQEVTPAGQVYARLVAGRPRFVGTNRRLAVWAPDFSRLPDAGLELLALAVDAELSTRGKGQ